MVTPWSPSGAPQTRSWAGLLHLFGLATMLFGLVYAHSVSTESVASHVAPAAATATQGGSGQAEAATADAEPVFLETPSGSHGDGHETSHPAQECVPGQPQHGVSLDAPSTSPLDMALSAAEATLGQAAPIGSGSAGSGLAESRTSAVMQV
ncbi:hypothetical protein QFZ24_002485 [Streptomyces phaeochromogenes]|nr:hypothetical protein [Streptomyces phaeochromogenes]